MRLPDGTQQPSVAVPVPVDKECRRGVTDVVKTNFEVRSSKIQGTGLFTRTDLPKRKKLGEISGSLVRLPHARNRVANSKKIYLIELSRSQALDCSLGNAFKYLNHSCEPNCFLRVLRMRVEVYALGRIQAGNELTVDYGITPHKDGMKCACRHKACRRKL